MIDFYAPLKDLFCWFKKRGKIIEVEPFVLSGPDKLDVLKQQGLIVEPNDNFYFARPESVSEKTEIPSPSHEVVFLLDKEQKTKRKVVCMANDKIDLVLLRKLRTL
ncbi:MAG: hypothetical protein V2A66_05685 [Pseudomonadota bacterium]